MRTQPSLAASPSVRGPHVARPHVARPHGLDGAGSARSPEREPFGIRTGRLCSGIRSWHLLLPAIQGRVPNTGPLARRANHPNATTPALRDLASAHIPNRSPDVSPRPNLSAFTKIGRSWPGIRRRPPPANFGRMCSEVGQTPATPANALQELPPPPGASQARPRDADPGAVAEGAPGVRGPQVAGPHSLDGAVHVHEPAAAGGVEALEVAQAAVELRGTLGGRVPRGGGAQGDPSVPLLPPGGPTHSWGRRGGGGEIGKKMPDVRSGVPPTSGAGVGLEELGGRRTSGEAFAEDHRGWRSVA